MAAPDVKKLADDLVTVAHVIRADALDLSVWRTEHRSATLIQPKLRTLILENLDKMADRIDAIRKDLS